MEDDVQAQRINWCFLLDNRWKHAGVFFPPPLLYQAAIYMLICSASSRSSSLAWFPSQCGEGVGGKEDKSGVFLSFGRSGLVVSFCCWMAVQTTCHNTAVIKCRSWGYKPETEQVVAQEIDNVTSWEHGETCRNWNGLAVIVLSV